MHSIPTYAIRIILTSALFLLQYISTTAGAQEIIMPESWRNAFYNISPLFHEDTVTIRIFGDVMMHSGQIENARKEGNKYDFKSYFHLMEDEIREADIAVANMEFTLAGEPYTGYPCFSAPDALAYHLADCGFDVFLTANNHIYDKGGSGASRTLRIYRKLETQYGIRFTGIAEDENEKIRNNPVIIRKKGIKVAFANFTYGTNQVIGSYWPRVNYIEDKTRIASMISKAEEEDADIVIALPHWGTEYELKHSPSQEKVAEDLADQGFDMIIGSHPHVIQDTQTIGKTFVAYSLGNAVSNMSAPDTQLGLMATIRIIRKHNGDIFTSGPEFTFLWCSRPGGFNESYTVIPVVEYIGRKSEWIGGWDHDKMMKTYERVRKTIGIEDKKIINE